jgi:hypothetical protein
MLTFGENLPFACLCATRGRHGLVEILEQILHFASALPFCELVTDTQLWSATIIAESSSRRALISKVCNLPVLHCVVMGGLICLSSALCSKAERHVSIPSSNRLWPCGICESVEKMLLRIEDAAILLVRETPILESPLSDPLLSSGIGPSGKAQA